ncbi:uncharacterized protein [Littorina saxatilis]|uniref:uncharacterized protein n=1 Tax=Littorina saxatilis TaxID=31220 RepID=UPI0038B65E23
MPPKVKLKENPVSKACVFCCSEEENEAEYGKMLHKSGISIHYFCMLFSSGLWQRGKRDQDGILGFMPADIRREQKRGMRLMCQYCRMKGATIGCCVSSCRKTFHFRCGREAGGLSQFYEEFRSYCPEHRPRQATPTSTSDRLAFYGTAKSTCSICMLAVEARSSNDTLRSPCCRHAWFHRDCIQRYAVSAGAYFFKCPLCNNKELFEAEMLEYGIYIPEQDAAWEQEPNAFQELLERYSHCDAEKCLCPQGRDHEGDAGSSWKLVLCAWCGSSGTHFGCRAFTKIGKERVCSGCSQISAVVEADRKKKKGSGSASPPQAPLSPEQIRQQVEQRRSSALRNARAARRSSSLSPDSGSQGPSASDRSQRAARRRDLSLPLADDTARVTSPTLLRDRRLMASIPVVRIQRAESEVEVNVTDSVDDEEEEEGVSAVESEDQSSARLLGLRGWQTRSQPARSSRGAEAWDIKDVIEKGRRKVVVLSMLKDQDYSSDSSVQSAAASLRSRLRLRSTPQGSEADDTDNEQSRHRARHLLSSRRSRSHNRPDSDHTQDSLGAYDSDTSKKRGPRRPKQSEPHSHSSDKELGSDDNGNSTPEHSSVEKEAGSPVPGPSTVSPKLTRSGLSRSQSLRHQKRASDSSSEEQDSNLTLPRIDTKRRKLTRNRSSVSSRSGEKAEAKRRVREYRSGSSDSTASAESMATKMLEVSGTERLP